MSSAEKKSQLSTIFSKEKLGEKGFLGQFRKRRVWLIDRCIMLRLKSRWKREFRGLSSTTLKSLRRKEKEESLSWRKSIVTREIFNLMLTVQQIHNELILHFFIIFSIS